MWQRRGELQRLADHAQRRTHPVLSQCDRSGEGERSPDDVDGNSMIGAPRASARHVGTHASWALRTLVSPRRGRW